MLLSLPTLDPSIPASIVFDSVNPHYLRLGRAMCAAGMVKREDVAGLSAERVDFPVVADVLKRAWRRELAALFEFRHLDVTATLYLPDERGADPWFEPEDGDGRCSLMVSGSQQPEGVVVGPAILALEGLAAGLGYTVLEILDSALYFFGIPCTPMGAYAMAQYNYWGGEGDERAALEECDDPEDAADVPRRAELFHGIPDWAYGGQRRKRLPPRELARLAAAGRGHPLAGLLTACVGIDRLLGPNWDYRSPRHMTPGDDEWEDCELFEPPCMLFWSAEGTEGRIIDDFYQYYMQGNGGPPAARFVRFAFDAHEISASLKRVRHTGSMLQALDAAIGAFKEFEHELPDFRSRPA